MTTFTRSQQITSYYGFEARASKKPITVAVSGEPVTAPVHPEVHIAEYPNVKIAGVKVSDDLVSVEFDASSAQTKSGKAMRHNFYGNTKTGTPLHKLAEAAHQSGRPVYVAFETRRKWKNHDGEVVALDTPMWELRGQDGPTGKANSNITSSNCSKIIAALGFADKTGQTLLSEEARSNPNTWAMVRHNHDATTAPEGFIIPQRADGTNAGCFLPADNAGGGGIAQRLDTIAKALEAANNSPAGRGARPWNLRLNNGQINAGSYVMAQIRHTRATAATLVAGAIAAAEEHPGVDFIRAEESRILRVLLWLSDEVQGRVCGHVDRSDKSWSESGAWVAHVAQVEDPLTLAMIGEEEEHKDAGRAWARRVCAASVDRFNEALTLTEEYVTSTAGRSHRAQTTATETTAQGAAEAPATGEQAPAMLADVPALQQRWDALIEAVGLVDHIDDLNPALIARFGTHLSKEIPADQFTAAMDEWEANPQGFRTWAGEQYSTANNQ